MYAIVVLSGGTTIFPRDGWAHDEWADGACCIHDEIKVVAEHFRSVEVLFQPSIIGKEASDPRHDADIRKELSANVVLSGGTAIFQWIIERMTKELTALALFTMKIKVVAPTW